MLLGTLEVEVFERQPPFFSLYICAAVQPVQKMSLILLRVSQAWLDALATWPKFLALYSFTPLPSGCNALISTSCAR